MFNRSTSEPGTTTTTRTTTQRTTTNQSGGGVLPRPIVNTYNQARRFGVPSWVTLLALIFGVLLGMIWAYNVSPIEFAGANPDRMNGDARDQWIKLVAASYDLDMYNEQDTLQLLAQVETPANAIQRLLQNAPQNSVEQRALSAVQPVAQNVGFGTPAPQEPAIVEQIIPFLLAVLAGLIIGIVAGLIINAVRGGQRTATTTTYTTQGTAALNQTTQSRTTTQRTTSQPQVRSSEPAVRQTTTTQETLAPAQPSIVHTTSTTTTSTQPQGRPLGSLINTGASNLVTQNTTMFGQPVLHQTVRYAGGGVFDETFSIDDVSAANGFLGECGASIAKAVVPRATAIDIWLFDMFTQTNQNKIITTGPALELDTLLRDRVSLDVANPAADIIPIGSDTDIVVDSKTLRLVARLENVQIAQDGQFAGFVMHLMAWHKDGQTVPASPGQSTAAQASPFGSSPSPQAPPPTAQPTAPTGQSSSPFGTSSPRPGAPSGGSPPPRSGTLSAQPMQPTENDSNPFTTITGNEDPFNTNLPRVDDDDDLFAGTGEFTPS